MMMNIGFNHMNVWTLSFQYHFFFSTIFDFFFIFVRRTMFGTVLLPDCSHMMTCTRTWFFMSGWITDNGYVPCLCSNHFTYSTTAIADYNNRWRLIRFGTILKKWRKLRFRHFFVSTNKFGAHQLRTLQSLFFSLFFKFILNFLGFVHFVFLCSVFQWCGMRKKNTFSLLSM